MRDYLAGWSEQSSVEIPSVKKKGFQENVIIRESVNPQKRRPVLKTVPEEVDDDATVVVSDEATVFKELTIPTLFLKRSKTGEIIKIEQEKFMIGKRNDSDYIIRDNPTISRKHACIYLENGEYWIEDLHTPNHVYVEGRMITEPTRLSTGVRFRLSIDENFEVVEALG